MNPHLLAQQMTINGVTINGPLNIGGGPITITSIIARVMTFLIPLASIILFASIVWGGYEIMMSQGDAGKLKEGRAKLTTGVVGFIILVLAYFITRLIAEVFQIGQGII